jgi:hypothetical protein
MTGRSHKVLAQTRTRPPASDTDHFDELLVDDARRAENAQRDQADFVSKAARRSVEVGERHGSRVTTGVVGVAGGAALAPFRSRAWRRSETKPSGYGSLRTPRMPCLNDEPQLPG